MFKTLRLKDLRNSSYLLMLIYLSSYKNHKLPYYIQVNLDLNY